jgi:hypothetical protein
MMVGLQMRTVKFVGNVRRHFCWVRKEEIYE